MISNISFGSTYKVNATGNDSLRQKQGYNDFIEFCDNHQFRYSENIDTKITKPNGKLTCTTQATLVAPDRFDRMIDAFLISKGIDFERYITHSLMQPKVINHRVKPAPKNMLTAYINVKKLEEIMKDQNSNFGHCQSDYNKYYKDRLDFMIKSGDAIPASTLYITPWNGTKNALDYIEKYGCENLNKNSINFDLNQTTDSPDHCMYFAMKDTGMASIPVYVDKDTYQLGLAMNLFEPTVY